MPIYEFYSPDTNRIYSFYAKTLAQGKIVPRCPDNPKARMVKLLSTFAVAGTRKSDAPAGPTAGAAPGGLDDPRMEAAMGAMEREFSRVDENDPRAMARMMRRMAELSGEKLDGPMEEAVRKLEEGADPDALESELGGAFGPEGEGGPEGLNALPPGAPGDRTEAKARFKARRPPPSRDPKLYDYE
jgi:hypothetical protein